jgi:hypothetical protein
MLIIRESYCEIDTNYSLKIIGLADELYLYLYLQILPQISEDGSVFDYREVKRVGNQKTGVEC